VLLLLLLRLLALVRRLGRGLVVAVVLLSSKPRAGLVVERS
jgi:hypothetical protein